MVMWPNFQLTNTTENGWHRGLFKNKRTVSNAYNFLSAKDEDIDKIQGLMSGAEDYITKPFNPLELMARIKSQLRRYRVYQTEEVKQFIHEIGHLKVDEETRQVFIRNEEVRLTPKEFDILSLLVRNKGKVFSVEKIYEMVWEDSFYKSDNTVMVHITKIREKLKKTLVSLFI